MNEIDPRLLSVSIEVNGRTTVYNQDFAIRATGMHYATPLNDECEVTIFNLDRATQDYLLTQTSPYTLNRSLKKLTVLAGRKSYGETVIYVGNIISSIVSQPPDIGVTLKCLTGFSFQAAVYSTTQAGTTTAQQVAEQLANNLQAVLKFEAVDKTLANYTFTGTAIQEMAYMNTIGGINIFLYGKENALIVKNWYVPLRNTLRIVDINNGMVGIPQFTEMGIRVKFFIDNKTTLGGALRVVSQRYPAFNGDYIIYKLGFDLASRDTPFYYTAEAARIPAGTTL
jgi:tRNA(Leu) C34 or U34 (ribose-2'-O)-methylase TrmL